MIARYKLIFLVIVGFYAILMATRLGSISDLWRGLVFFLGGWLMAVGMLYQVKLYADWKDVQYYVLLVFTIVFWLSMTAVSLFQLGLLTGWLHQDLG